MKRFFSIFTHVLVLTFLITSIAQAGQLALPAADVTAPVIIENDHVTNIDAGKDHQILVTATDNIAIKSVILFHRDMGGNEYQALPMQNIVDTDDYAVTLGTDQLSGEGIEYYIQATDYTGNTLLHGYAFSPITVTVNHQTVEPTLASTSPTRVNPPPTKKEKSYKWLWIGLGVLAAGAIAASGGDDGGGDTGSSASDEPTVVINAPVP